MTTPTLRALARELEAMAYCGHDRLPTGVREEGYRAGQVIYERSLPKFTDKCAECRERLKSFELVAAMQREADAQIADDYARSVAGTSNPAWGAADEIAVIIRTSASEPYGVKGVEDVYSQRPSDHPRAATSDGQDCERKLIGELGVWGGWVCEGHPEKDFPHDDCPGPGIPKAEQVQALVYQRDRTRGQRNLWILLGIGSAVVRVVGRFL